MYKRIHKPSKVLLVALVLASQVSFANEIKTNAVVMAGAPDWVTPQRIDKIVDHIESLLEWDIRRVKVTWYTSQTEFEKVHGLGPTVLAISRKNDNTVHIGPRVNDANFDGVFGHEMVHIISFQKYKGAIPAWLEEGLANYLSQRAKVDYVWLSKHPAPDDVRELIHPYNGVEDHIRYCYMASQALTEMIASKCDLSNLLRLSVGRKMEKYLDTYCGIKNLTTDFKDWVSRHKQGT
jgi:hypothetical protein